MCIQVEKQKASFLITSSFFYVFLGIICGLESGDFLYTFYSVSLGIYSCIYHYYGELRYFWEDFTCSFFFKLHIFSNYIIWMDWEKILIYIFLSDVIGYIIFYFSVTTWKSKYLNYGYIIFHNIWHTYTGGIAFYIGIFEKRVDIGYWNGFFFIIFFMAMIRCKKPIFRLK